MLVFHPRADDDAVQHERPLVQPRGVESAQKVFQLALESDAGRRYGSFSGDVNPVHVAPWLARLFGFRSHIAHGMAVQQMAMAAAQLDRHAGIAVFYRR